MSEILFKQVTILDPQGKHNQKQADIYIKDGVIQVIDLSCKFSPNAKTIVIEEAGSYVSPGWIDMEVHLSDPGFEFKESISELAKAALSGGYSGLLCYPNTDPITDNSQLIQSIQARADKEAVHFLLSGSVSQGAQGKDLAEMYDMHSEGAVAFTDGTHPIQSAGLMYRALLYARSFDGLIINCPLDMTVIPEGQMNEGKQSVILGMKGIPEISETLVVSRDLQLLEYTNARRLHLQSLSSPEALRLAGEAKSRFPNLSLGTSISHLVLNDEKLAEFDPNFKLYPPLRDDDQRKQLLNSLKSGVIDVISSGHTPQGLEEKEVEFAQAEPGMLSLYTSFALANMYLIQTKVITIEDWVRMVAINPRLILKIPQVVIEEGATAEISWFAPNKTWTFSSEQIFSRAKNSPFIGEKLTGKALGVYCKGGFHDNR